MIERGTLKCVQVEPLRFTADQFSRLVRSEVEERKAAIVMVDSIAGYKLSLRGEDLVSHLHGLAKYLQNMGVATLLVNEVETITGDFRATEVGISYVADNIVFMRYLESRGEMRKAIGVLKKRLTDFEKTLREFSITPDGLVIGEPMREMRGILRGVAE
jgi:circadian clock protein KaiC